LAFYLITELMGKPFVLRGTRIPWGLLVAGLGAIFLAFDLWRTRRAARIASSTKAAGPPDER
jgi:hypothetical protein